jgi:hypothetical protein
MDPTFAVIKNILVEEVEQQLEYLYELFVAAGAGEDEEVQDEDDDEIDESNNE